ncbi:MAG: helix-turn-helix domain-containing protein [Chloroflexota bacterium]
MDIRQPSPFALLLRGLRREADLTQEGLAERAGVAWRTISDLERGLKLPRRDTLALLVEALALTGERRAAFEAAAHRKPDPPDSGVPATMPAWPSPPTSTVPLVGRTEELALLDRHLAGQGRPVLFLAGQPGSGGRACRRGGAAGGRRALLSNQLRPRVGVRRGQ